jgi:hypothetical protein
MSDNKTLRALVIDPDARALTDAVRLLTRRGFHVAGRITPVDSLEYVRRARPDVVLLGLPFWEEGWGTEILGVSPETVVLPIVGGAGAPGIRIAAGVA